MRCEARGTASVAADSDLLCAGDMNCTDIPADDASVFDELDFASRLDGARVSSRQFRLRMLCARKRRTINRIAVQSMQLVWRSSTSGGRMNEVKLTSSTVSTGIGDHLWRVYHHGIFHSAWPSLRGSVQ